ncbi:MAG: cation-translocating P-type ATPase, partial [Candidatus Micrarchaeia archaeon]
MQKNDEKAHAGKRNNAACSCCATDIFEEKPPLWRQNKAVLLLSSLLLLGIGLYVEFALFQELLAHILYLAVVLLAGQEIIGRAWSALLRRRLDMNFLMVFAAAAAFASGHAEEAASIIFLFAVAEFLEDYAGERARNSIAALLKLAPETARVRRNGREATVHVHELAIGDTVIVKPGDRIPIDGVVHAGSSYVNQAPITGESRPVGKRKGDPLYAGTINEQGYLELKVTKKSGQTMLARIASIVENAQKQKSKTERFVDTFASYYTPLVIAAAVAVAVLPTLLFGQPFETWFYRALVLLVVSCPCALAISTPVSLVSSIASAARNGVLVKGGAYVEETGKAKAIILDKTGTLTTGEFEVEDVIAVNSHSKEELLRIAASLESASTHPIAAAILRKASMPLYKVSRFSSMAGKGLRGTISGREYFIGNLKLPVKIDDDSVRRMLELESEGKTVVVVSTREKVVGLISISDHLREGAAEAVAELGALGVTPVMLTGDNRETAQAIAKRLGIRHFHAGLLPEQKLAEVRRLKKKYGSVIMVGDGVNDAPALAAADVGIAMGAIGSDVAIETADVALMGDDISKLPYFVKLSRKTMMVVKENIAVSILVKGSFAVLAFFGLATLWMAVAAGDMGLSLLVIMNALR